MRYISYSNDVTIEQCHNFVARWDKLRKINKDCPGVVLTASGLSEPLPPSPAALKHCEALAHVGNGLSVKLQTEYYYHMQNMTLDRI